MSSAGVPTVNEQRSRMADGQVWTATLKHDAASSDSMLRLYLLHTACVQKAILDA